MTYIVYKLGGTSQCKIGYDTLINKFKDNVKYDIKNAIVLSAVTGVTNNLVKFTETKNYIYIDKALELNYNIITNLDLKKDLFDNVVKYFIELCQNYIKSYDILDIYEKSEIIGYGEVFSTHIFYRYIESILDSELCGIQLFDSYKETIQHSWYFCLMTE
jgi:aspartokinase